jgi:hypothetical protein
VSTLARGLLGRFEQDLPVTGIAAGGDPSVAHGGQDGTIGLLQVRAIGEAAAHCRLAHLAERLRQVARLDGSEPELVDTGAIDKEAGADSVEPPRGRRLPSQAAPRDLADRRFSSQRAKDRALSNPGVSNQQCAAIADEVAQRVDVLVRLGINDGGGVPKVAIELRQRLVLHRIAEVGFGQYDGGGDPFDLGDGKELIERDESGRRVGEGSNGDDQVDVGRHGLRATRGAPAFERKTPRLQVLDQRLFVFQNAYAHDIARHGHEPRAGHAAQLRVSRPRFTVNGNQRGILPGGDHECSLRFAHTQECTIETANDEASVFYLTLSFDKDVDGEQRAAIEAAVFALGGSVVWRTRESAGRSYALLQLPENVNADAIRALPGATVYDGSIIALAVFPEVTEALPKLLDALGGPGRPAGILACRPCPGGLVLEWDPARTRALVVLGLVDVELQRFHSGRVSDVLSPLSPELAANLAAEGLAAPEIEPKRILELRIDRV